MLQAPLTNIIPDELQQPLAPSLRAQQIKSEVADLFYRALIANVGSADWKACYAESVLGYGGVF